MAINNPQHCSEIFFRIISPPTTRSSDSTRAMTLSKQRLLLPQNAPSSNAWKDHARLLLRLGRSEEAQVSLTKAVAVLLPSVPSSGAPAAAATEENSASQNVARQDLAPVPSELLFFLGCLCLENYSKESAGGSAQDPAGETAAAPPKQDLVSSAKTLFRTLLERDAKSVLANVGMALLRGRTSGEGGENGVRKYCALARKSKAFYLGKLDGTEGFGAFSEKERAARGEEVVGKRLERAEEGVQVFGAFPGMATVGVALLGESCGRGLWEWLCGGRPAGRVCVMGASVLLDPVSMWISYQQLGTETALNMFLCWMGKKFEPFCAPRGVMPRSGSKWFCVTNYISLYIEAS